MALPRVSGDALPCPVDGGAMRLLLALLFMPVVALAESWSMPNQNGGEIVITDRNCFYKGEDYGPLKQAYTHWNGGYIEGCWLLEDGMIKILWQDPKGITPRMYKIEHFTQKTKPSKQQPRS